MSGDVANTLAIIGGLLAVVAGGGVMLGVAVTLIRSTARWLADKRAAFWGRHSYYGKRDRLRNKIGVRLLHPYLQHRWTVLREVQREAERLVEAHPAERHRLDEIEAAIGELRLLWLDAPGVKPFLPVPTTKPAKEA